MPLYDSSPETVSVEENNIVSPFDTSRQKLDENVNDDDDEVFKIAPVFFFNTNFPM